MSYFISPAFNLGRTELVKPACDQLTSLSCEWQRPNSDQHKQKIQDNFLAYITERQKG
jgi:hypothetical protein